MKAYLPYDTPTALAPVDGDGVPSGGGGGGSPASGGVGSVIATLGSIASAAGPVGVIITAVVAVIAALGLRIRGTTRHLSFDEVQPAAAYFRDNVDTIIANTYGRAAFQSIADRVVPLFLRNMQAFWGMGPSLNQQIAFDVQTNPILNRQLWLFATWVGTNVDADRPETYNQFIRDLFVMIFGQAIADAGLDPTKLAPVSGGAPGGGNGTKITPPLGGGGSGAPSAAGMQTVAKYGGAALAVGLLVYLSRKAS